uniref:Uncharacterized protein n=1 Tax=Aegilops tauschii subsp. strangulata TaxID=200361 RepID=A0A453IL96_AEGTS
MSSLANCMLFIRVQIVLNHYRSVPMETAIHATTEVAFVLFS